MALMSNVLNPTGLAVVVAILGIGWLIVSTIHSWYRLRHVPGPWLASFSYLWLIRNAVKGIQLEAFKTASKEYGSLIRVGPNEILTDDPDVIRRMSSVKSTYLKSGWYLGTRAVVAPLTMFNIQDPVAHDRYKAKVGPGYSGRDIPNLEADVDTQVESFVRLIRNHYISSPEAGGVFRPMDLATTVSYFTIDAIFKLAFGKELGSLESNSDYEQIHETLTSTMRMTGFMSDVSWMRNIFFTPLLKLFGPSDKDKTGPGKAMKMANDRVRELFQPTRDKTKATTMVESFIKHGLSQAECQVETLFMFLAGSDTSATTIRTTMLYVISTPRVYQQLKREIATAVREGRVSSPIKMSEAKELPYLQAIVYEGLRIRPSLLGLTLKEVPEEGDMIDGKFIPGGTAVGMNFHAVSRSRAAFGQDADFFRPERYLEVDSKTAADMRRHVELTFGSGRWACAGKPIAMMELNKVFFELFRYFDFQLMNPEKPMSTFYHALAIEEDLIVRVTECDILAC